MKRRAFHTVDLIQRLFEQAETGEPDMMDLLGLHDELSRLERKWREQFATGLERRKPEHIDQLNQSFDRLQRLIDRQLRTRPADDAAAALREIFGKIAARKRTW